MGASIVANSLTLSGATGTVALDASTESITLTPAGNLRILTTYSATLSEDIINLTADLMGTDYDWSFTAQDGDWGMAELIETDNAGGAGALKLPLIAAAIPLQCGGKRTVLELTFGPTVLMVPTRVRLN